MCALDDCKFSTTGALALGSCRPPEMSSVWLGLEYFCDQGDDLWAMEDMNNFWTSAIGEVEKIGLIERKACDRRHSCSLGPQRISCVLCAAYNQFGELRNFLDGFSNLYPIGRNEHAPVQQSGTAPC